MKLLEERILSEGRILENGILKVDGFVNHQVDPMLMDTCGREFANTFAHLGATKVLTAEISGIAPALTTALHLGIPVASVPGPILGLGYIPNAAPPLPSTGGEAELACSALDK